MIDLIFIRAMQIYEIIRRGDLPSFLRKVVYTNRKALIFEKDLTDVKDGREFLNRSNIEFIEITLELLSNKYYHYRSRNHFLQALYNLKMGYRGFAIARRKEIIGDIWYFANDQSMHKAVHPHIQQFCIKLSKNDVYAFDLFIDPKERGNNIATALQNSAMFSLYQKGFLKAYVYCWADNIPSIWTTRVINKWKEIDVLEMSRYLILKRIGRKPK
jgi:hypothetical protein